jgi:hypothetical protein
MNKNRGSACWLPTVEVVTGERANPRFKRTAFVIRIT